jgi:D-3-phosphoglycerate dehydrogenase
MYRILVSDKLGQAGLDRLDQAEDAEYDMITGLGKDELLAIIPQYDALIIRSGTKVDADVLQAGSNLKVVGRAGMGVDNIDINAATMAGIIVMNTPGANSMATAEQTMAMMLAVSRHIPQAYGSLKAGEWKRSSYVGSELYNKTLGIIGFGRIGRLVAERALAFGMEVLAYDPFVSEVVARDLGVTLVDLEDMLPEADYITLHTALLPATESMINTETIGLMKDGVIIVNVARGKLIDDDALADGLQSGKVKAAAIDVYRQEPPPPDNPLLDLPNVITTPHLGASTFESQRQVATQIVDQVLAALRGTDFAHSLNMPFQLKEGSFDDIRPFMELGEKLGRLHSGLAEGQVQRVEVEVQGDVICPMVRAIASAILKGLLSDKVDGPLNYINAPVLAEEQRISITQATGIKYLDYANLITSRVSCTGAHHVLGGVLMGGSEPRLVQVDHYRLEAKPDGIILLLLSRDVPGVIGQVATLLAKYKINIAEWRHGRDQPGGESLSFINLDDEPPATVLEELSGFSAINGVKLIKV